MNKKIKSDSGSTSIQSATLKFSNQNTISDKKGDHNNKSIKDMSLNSTKHSDNNEISRAKANGFLSPITILTNANHALKARGFKFGDNKNQSTFLYIIARKSILVFSALGIMISIYMFYAKLNTSALVCGISPCYVVNESQYSYLFGIPLSAYGVAFYLLIFILALLMKKYLLFWVSVFGVLFSVYLTYLEFFVIHAWCQWCITSAFLTLLIFLTASILFFKFRTR